MTLFLAPNPPLPLSLPSDRVWGLMCALGRKAECRFDGCWYPEHPAAVPEPEIPEVTTRMTVLVEVPVSCTPDVLGDLLSERDVRVLEVHPGDLVSAVEMVEVPPAREGVLMGPLPEGVTKIETVDWGVGPLLLVHFANGMALSLDALALAEYECQVVVHRSSAALDEGLESGSQEHIIGGISFDPKLPPSAWPA